MSRTFLCFLSFMLFLGFSTLSYSERLDRLIITKTTPDRESVVLCKNKKVDVVPGKVVECDVDNLKVAFAQKGTTRTVDIPLRGYMVGSFGTGDPVTVKVPTLQGMCDDDCGCGGNRSTVTCHTPSGGKWCQEAKQCSR